MGWTTRIGLNVVAESFLLEYVLFKNSNVSMYKSEGPAAVA